jgi:hypothetical protein
MSTEKKYIEWDLEKFKQGWPAEWSGSPARFIAHIPDADEYSRLAWLVEGVLYASTDSGTGVYRSPLRLLARELDPHPDNKDGLYRDQIGDGWRIKGHGEPVKPQDQVWHRDKLSWEARTYPAAPLCGNTYRTRDPMPEPAFKVGDRVRHNDGEIGTVIKSDSKVTVRWSDVPVTYDPDGSGFFTKLTTRTVPLGPEDIVLGKTVVRACEGQPEILVIGRDEAGIGDAPMRLSWETLRTRYEISFNHGVTWQKAEKEVEG